MGRGSEPQLQVGENHSYLFNLIPKKCLRPIKSVDIETLISDISMVSYRIVSYRIVSYRIVSYRIVSYRIVSYRIVSYRIVSYRIVSYRITDRQIFY